MAEIAPYRGRRAYKQGMATMHPQTLYILAAITIAVMLMVKAGLARQMLELKPRRRNCPSGGRPIRGRVCDRH